MTTTFDFGFGPVPAHQHINGGGWVADTAIVAETAYIGPDAMVSGDAQVYDRAQVFGNARVYDRAGVSGNAAVFDNAMVSGDAQVYDRAQVFGNALVSGNALVYGNARVYGDAHVTNRKFPQIKRSDGYDFIAVPCKDGKVRVTAGCRYFTFKEAKQHWKSTRGGTPLGDETMLILKYLKAYTKLS